MSSGTLPLRGTRYFNIRGQPRGFGRSYGAGFKLGLIEMYLAGISVRRVEDITEALWGTRVSPSTVSNLNKKIYAKIEAWRNRRHHYERTRVSDRDSRSKRTNCRSPAKGR
jgi:transposase-like protein